MVPVLVIIKVMKVWHRGLDLLNSLLALMISKDFLKTVKYIIVQT